MSVIPKKLFLFILAAVLIFPTVMFSGTTGKLAGTVTDKATGEPVPGVNVIVEGTTLGAATNSKGEFFIINVDAGVYSVRVSMIGYANITKKNVRVLPDFTTKLDYQLAEEAMEGEEVVVIAERPLIQKDQTGSVQVTTSEEIRNLPIRGINSVTQISAGVVEDGSTRGDNLHVRGGRANEVGFYVDGFMQNDQLSGNAFTTVANNAIEEVIVITGGFDAKYGQRASGLTQVITKSGGTKYNGSFEYVTDRVSEIVPSTTAFNRDVMSATLGGPIWGKKLRFFVGGEWTLEEDREPGIFGYPSVTNADTTTACRNSAGVVVPCDDPDAGDPSFVNCFDAEGNRVPCSLEDGNGVLIGPNPESVGVRGFVDTDENGNPIYNEGPRPNKSNKEDSRSINAKITFNPIPALKFDLNTVASDRKRHSFGFSNSRLGGEEYFFTPLHVPQDNRFTANLGLTGTWTINPRSFIKVGGNVFTTTRKVRDRQDVPVEDLAGTHLGFFGQSTQNSFNLFRSEGRHYTALLRTESSRWEVKADYESQLNNNHYVKIGGEFQRSTIRYYFGGFAGSGGPLANNPNQFGYYADTSGGKWKLKNAEDYKTDLFGFYSSAGADPQFNPNLDGAKHPILAAGYIQDKIEYEGLIVNIGLRVDYLDTQQKLLLNVQDPTGSQDSLQLASFQDLNGNGTQDYLDLNGNGIKDPNEPTERTLGGTIGKEDFSNKENTDVTFSPRIAVSFPVSDKTLFRISYGKFYQVPDFDQLYIGSLELQNNSVSPGGATVTNNPNVDLSESDEYEVGLTKQLGSKLRFDGTAYYRDIKDLINVSNVESRPAALTLVQNFDQAVVKGFDFALELRRINNFSARVSYGIAFAEGTGSIEDGNFQNAWLDFETAKVTNPLDFDQRHTLSMIADYRVGEGEGLVFGNFRPFENSGINVLLAAGSGFPYTPTVVNGIAIGGVPAANATAPINSNYGPWQVRIDLKANRTFQLYRGLSTTLYVEVLNVLNRENPNNVYAATGDPYNDGFLASVSGLANIASEGARYSGQYLSRLNNNFFFQAPRQVRGGIIMEF